MSHRTPDAAEVATLFHVRTNERPDLTGKSLKDFGASVKVDFAAPDDPLIEITGRDAFLAVFNIDGDIVMSGKDKQAFEAVAAWLRTSNQEEHELLAETVDAFIEQRNKDGIRQDDINKLRHAFLSEVGHLPLASVAVEDVL